MGVDSTQTPRIGSSKTLRADEAKKVVLSLPDPRVWCGPVLVSLGLLFVLAGGADSELRSADARVGLAAKAGFHPLGQVFGQWRPDVWPLRVAVTRVSHFLEEPGRPLSGTVLWPSAIAGLIAGWIVARRLLNLEKFRLSLIFGFAWFGSVALLDHSSSLGLDLLTGMATIAALDRLIGRASDWTTGLWASLAFLSGGWPPLVVLALAVIVLGRREADFSVKLILPPVLTSALWLAWTVKAASVEVAAAALAWPLTQKPDWTLALQVLALGLPLSPFALLLISGPLRKRLRETGCGLVIDWLQIGIAAAIGGTVIPGLATASRFVALMGVLVAAAAALDAAWSGALSSRARRAFLGTVFALTAGWVFIAVYGGYLMILAFPYYRPVGVIVSVLSVGVLGTVWWSIESRNARRSVVAMLLLTACLKLVHWGYYTPEWNYRHGQGPWGRAVAQWLMPNWTLYTIHEWPEDFAWTIGRPIRQLPSAHHLAYPATPESKHTLLLESEFENWPVGAPKLIKVASFQDPYGRSRILARTEGILVTPAGRVMQNSTKPE